MAATEPEHGSTPLPLRIAAAWTLGLVALAAAAWAGQSAVETLAVGRLTRYGLQALIMSGLVVPGIWWLRTRIDRRPLAGLEVLGFRRSLIGFAIGAGLILLPLVVTLVLTDLLGWATVTLNTSTPALGALAAGFFTVLFFEALPEELVFRGYIYRNLNTVQRRWVAGAVTVALFVLLPVVVVPIQRNLLGMEIQVGPSDRITGGYLVMMACFGAFVQYLRILTGTVWTGIGFHLHFVFLNRIVSPREGALINLSDLTTEGPMQVTLLITVLLVLAALVLSPRYFKRSLGWNQIDPE
jgi:membrane protease YdiL (CAAX protease family)